jgi:hypothetical protein
VLNGRLRIRGQEERTRRMRDKPFRRDPSEYHHERLAAVLHRRTGYMDGQHAAANRRVSTRGYSYGKSQGFRYLGRVVKMAERGAE